jgi:hypothetical protein
MRFIERAGQAKLQGLEDLLKPYEALRVRFWKPSLVQLARKVKEYRSR